MLTIKISDDFSDAPGGRYIQEGDNSGEQFREELLFPKYEEALKNNDKLEINFDDCFGFGTSFLEEAFGGLVRVHKKKGILNTIIIIATEDETIPGNIQRFVREAEDKLK